MTAHEGVALVAPTVVPGMGGRAIHRDRTDSKASAYLCALVRVAAAFLLWTAVCPPARAEAPRLVVQTGHGGGVTALALSRDGALLASASGDKLGNGEIKLWDVATGLELRTMRVWGHAVQSLSFDPGGTTLATAEADGIIRLWGVTSGKETAQLKGDADGQPVIAFSPNGTTLAVSGDEGAVRLWDTRTRRIIQSLVDGSGWMPTLAFSSDGSRMTLVTQDMRVVSWDVRTGARKEAQANGPSEVLSSSLSRDGTLLATVHETGEEGEATSVLVWEASTGAKRWTLEPGYSLGHAPAFSADGHWLVTVAADSRITLWDLATGQRGRTIASGGGVGSVAFSPNSAVLVTGQRDGTLVFWDLATGAEQRRLSRHAQAVGGLSLSPDGRWLANGHEYLTQRAEDNTLAGGLREYGVRLWDLVRGRESRSLPGHTGDVFVVQFSPDGRSLASGSMDGTVRLWDVTTGKTTRSLAAHAATVSAVSFAPDGRTLATAGWDGLLRIWDVGEGALRRSLRSRARWTPALVFSPDGKLLASSAGKAIYLWDAATGEERKVLAGRGEVNSVPFSPDGTLLASASTDGTVRLWDLASGETLRTLGDRSAAVTQAKFDATGARLATGDDAGTVRTWDVATGAQLRSFLGHSGRINSVAFYPPEGRILVSGSIDGTLRLWDTASGKELARLIALDGQDWAVLTPEGLFDASAKGMDLLHWVVGNEPIALSQLKERYHEPGLLAKVLGFNKEPLRDVRAFTEVGLHPLVEFDSPVAGDRRLALRLTNRGGGIGRVQVFVNDKEVAADARAPRSDPSAARATMAVDLAGASLLPGQTNRVRVVAWNAEGYLSSRGVERVWTVEGVADAPPQLHAIVAGISTYASESLALRYAAKDAEDMARALEIGAKGLLGPDRVHMTLLSTSGHPGVASPTKANLRAAFEAARQAKPWDILVVYLAGHALALGGGQETYGYLTSEARGADLSDPEVRRQWSVTSEELVDWIKQVPALKQVMVLDTCAAGLAAAKLTETRDVGSGQIRAVERLKDRTGFHVLMGSAADAVSYEASQYGQGLLTYALLQGLRGAALRDGEYADVSRLFQYAADQVPELARHLGGIQRPVVAAPRGTSFDVGRLTTADREAIPLAMVKPLVLRPVLQNVAEGFDDLELMKALRSGLREASHPAEAGASPRLVYVDEDELPGAVRPSGTYVVEGEQVRLRLILTRDRDKVKELQIDGPKAAPAVLVDRILQALIPALWEAMAR